MKSLIFSIMEHQSFGCDTLRDCFGNIDLVEKFFKSLEDFAKNNSSLLGYQDKHRLKAKNYVGIIQTPYGVLEILPKCFDSNELNQTREFDSTFYSLFKQKAKDLYQIEKFEDLSKNDFVFIKDLSKLDPKTISRKFLLECLKYHSFIPKVIKNSFLQTSKLPLLDIFIQMFCQEFFEIYKRGVRHDYVNIQENRSYLKGKILFKEHIKYNLIHKECFYTSSEEYLSDIPQNRLIKTTLEFLKNKASLYTTLNQINQALEIFKDIPKSRNHILDFRSCVASRHFNYYDNILQWCKLFLEGNSFDIYGGKHQAYALLFPMEKLFEKYIACVLKKYNSHYFIREQKSDKSLLAKNNKKRFQMSVDLYIKKDNKVIIADTKWKQLCLDSSKHFGISQSDLYQLFSYGIYHQADEVWLIYPLIYTKKMEEIFDRIQEEIDKSKYIFETEVYGAKSILLKIIFAPLC